MQKGNWSQLTDYLIRAKCGGKSIPKKVILSQDNLCDITGSVQQSKLYKNHTTHKDIVKRAEKAGYLVKQLKNGDCIFSKL